MRRKITSRERFCMAGQGMNERRPIPVNKSSGWAALKSPLLRFLGACHADFSAETGGTVAGERIMRNLARLLADRLIVANAKVNLLTAS
jgi:hypothetical protein